MSESLRMTNDSLREKVEMSLDHHLDVSLWELADLCLAALGLNDLDAAVERGARRLVWEQHQGCVQWDDDPTDTATSGSEQMRGYALEHARAVLEAALTATPSSANDGLIDTNRQIATGGPHDG